jgi:hypothetical protein
MAEKYRILVGLADISPIENNAMNSRHSHPSSLIPSP